MHTSRKDGRSTNRLNIQVHRMIRLDPPLSQILFHTSVSGNAKALLKAINASAVQLV